MNKFIYIAVALSLFCACEKTVEKGKNDNNKDYLDAWIKVNYPNAKKSPMGAYIISETPGNGVVAGNPNDYPYVQVNYTIRELDGMVISTNNEDLAKQVGDYDITNNYIPKIWSRANNSLLVGVDEMLEDMKVGGKKTSVIPSWLFTNNRYNTVEEYYAKVDYSSNAIYEVELVDAIKDIKQFELDSLKRYVQRVYGDKAVQKKDGFYYVQDKEPKDTLAYPNDTTIHINYVGRLLNGKVFDTNIADTAKCYSIYKSSTTYEPASVKWNTDYKEITLQSNTVIDGFAYLLSKMRRNEKARGIFVSSLGYGSEGSGLTIPSYSPLIFEIEIVNK